LFDTPPSTTLEHFGFKFGRGGAHAARTLMLPELRQLLDGLPKTATSTEYPAAIVASNLLDKPTLKARQLTYRHLRDLYQLDPSACLFRLFRRLWSLDTASQPVLALSMALTRDALLRASVPVILKAEPGAVVSRAQMEARIEAWADQRFSQASLVAIAQRLNGSWTQAGYLQGKTVKTRVEPLITEINLAFCLFLAYLEGREAQRLLSSDWVRVLNLPEDRSLALLQQASRRGLLIFRHSGQVMEIRFPNQLTPQEEAWRHEQT